MMQCDNIFIVALSHHIIVALIKTGFT